MSEHVGTEPCPECSISLKLKYSAHNTFIFGELQMTFSEPQHKYGHKGRRDDDRTGKLESAKPLMIERGKITHM